MDGSEGASFGSIDGQLDQDDHQEMDDMDMEGYINEDYLSDQYYDGEEGGNEGDEAVNLADVLSARDGSLVEEELWALCRECCLVLEVVNNSPEAFNTLCITPDTVAFDNAGNVCFLDLGSGRFNMFKVKYMYTYKRPQDPIGQ